MKRARPLVVMILFTSTGCSLIRSADDIIVGTGDAGADGELLDSTLDTPDKIDSVVMDSSAGDTPDQGETAVVDDRRWALFRMPSNTPTGYVVTADTVVDSLTKLEWQKAAGPASTFEASDAACKALPGGRWRLPFRIELISLLAIVQGTRPAINASVFPATPLARFWTSSTLSTGGRYVVNFEDANVESRLGTESFPYRCVRSP